MRSDDLMNALNGVDETMVARSVPSPSRRRRQWLPAVIGLAAALAVIVTAAVLLPGHSGQKPRIWPRNDAPTVSASPTELASYVQADAAYPVMPILRLNSSDEESAARQEAQERQRQYAGAAEGLEDFFCTTSAQFLSDTDGENRVYSPVNVYLALGMLAEITDGNTRNQVLQLLGTDDMDALRRQAYAVWNTCYFRDCDVTSVPAASMWLSDDYTFNNNTLQRLAENYYASSYRGTMGSEDFDSALRAWVNSQTGELLEEQTADLKLDPMTVISLVTTLYYEAKWVSTISPNDTADEVFHAPGGDVTCPFLHTFAGGLYGHSSGFDGAYLNLCGGGGMWFILPDEGTDTDAVLENPELYTMLLQGASHRKVREVDLRLSMPKFDVSSSAKLKEQLKALGVTDCFDADLADFAPLLEGADAAEIPIWVDDVRHDARVAIDEEGVTAATVTKLDDFGMGGVEREEVTFTVDRPFLFALTAADGTPLFLGVVNNP